MQAPDCVLAGDADIKHAAIDGAVALMAPVHQPPSEVIEIQPSAGQQGGEQAQGLGTIVGPGSAGGVAVGARETGWGLHFDLVEWRNVFRLREFVGDAQGVAHQQPDQAAGDVFGGGPGFGLD